LTAPLMSMGRSTISDAFALLVTMSGAYLIFEKKRLVPGLVLLLFGIFARTDSVLLVLPILAVLWLSGEINWWTAATLERIEARDDDHQPLRRRLCPANAVLPQFRDAAAGAGRGARASLLCTNTGRIPQRVNGDNEELFPAVCAAGRGWSEEVDGAGGNWAGLYRAALHRAAELPGAWFAVSYLLFAVAAVRGVRAT